MRTILMTTLMMATFGCKHSGGNQASAVMAQSDGTAAEDTGFFQQELITPSGTFPANHGSTVLTLGPGHLMSCWFAGSREAARDVEIYCAERDAAATDTKWSAPRSVVARGESSRGASNKFIGNPVLFKDLDGTIWLFYEAVKAFGHSASVVDYKISHDNGKTFSKGAAFAGSFTDFGHLPRNKPLQLSSGRFMVPVYREFLKKAGYTITVTPNRGAIVEKKSHSIPGSEHIQPALVMIEDQNGTNQILAFMRNTNGTKVLMSKFDLTKSAWSAPVETNAPNPNSAVDAINTADNKILMVYNDTPTGRAPLSIGISEDGVTFKKIHDLETTPGEWSYPAIIKDEEGTYHLTYTYDRKTIKYVTFNEAWLKSKK